MHNKICIQKILYKHLPFIYNENSTYNKTFVHIPVTNIRLIVHKYPQILHMAYIYTLPLFARNALSYTEQKLYIFLNISRMTNYTSELLTHTNILHTSTKLQIMHTSQRFTHNVKVIGKIYTQNKFINTIEFLNT